VSPLLLVIALTCGAAALALWIDARFPRVHPSTLVLRLVSAGGAAVVLRAIRFPADPPALQIAVLFGIVFPALVWAFVSAIGLLRYLRAAALRI
jgi:hypothetical protein